MGTKGGFKIISRRVPRHEGVYQRTLGGYIKHFLAHLWGAYAIPMALSGVRRPSFIIRHPSTYTWVCVIKVCSSGYKWL